MPQDLTTVDVQMDTNMTIVKKDAKVSCDQWLIISSVRLTSDKIVLGGWGGECMRTGTRSVGLTRF